MRRSHPWKNILEKKKMHQAKAGTNCICLNNRKKKKGAFDLYQSKLRRKARNKIRKTARVLITQALTCVTL